MRQIQRKNYSSKYARWKTNFNEFRKRTVTDINELIDMAWSDDVTFSDIEKATGLKESAVKRIMQANLKPSSYKLWRNRVRWIKEKRKKISN